MQKELKNLYGVLKMDSKRKFRKNVKEIWEREWIRDSLLLRNKKPKETLEVMFDLMKFAEELNKRGNEDP